MIMTRVLLTLRESKRKNIFLQGRHGYRMNTKYSIPFKEAGHGQRGHLLPTINLIV